MRTLLFSAAIALASFGCKKAEQKPQATEGSAEAKYEPPEISVDDVAAGLEAKTLTVFDCNMDETRKKDGVLAGATMIDDTEAYPASLLPADKSAKIVFYCAGHG